MKVIRHKYRNVPTERDGIRFDSRKESKRYEELKLLQHAGTVVFFLRQTSFHLPGKTIYRADFLVFWENGEVTVEDVKGGVRTESYKIKKRQVEEIYPVTIMEI